MANRKKRLEKGIESLKEQVAFHKKKQEVAQEEGNVERVDYYEREIEKFIYEIKKKQEMLEE